MQTNTRKVLRRIGTTLMWLGVLAGFVVILVAAVNDKNDGKCTGIVVKLQGDEANFFIEERDIRALVAKDKDLNPVGKPIKNINTANLERIVSRDPWVKNAEIFIDNQRKLNIKVTQRDPVARVFTTTGNSFYFDRDGDRIPVSARYAARVPVFTDFPTDAVKLKTADSSLAAGIMTLGTYIMEEPFWSAQIEQVVITPGREFEIIPKLGDHVIAFGDGTDVDKKFSKLLAFYKEGLNKVGWNNYARINVAYENEVVCTRRNGEELSRKLASADSARIAGFDSSAKFLIHHDEVTQAETTSMMKPTAKVTPQKHTQAKVAAPKQVASKPKVQKSAAPVKKGPKAVYKPVKKSVNTTKNNRTP
jgi:cell division protein FtsQ